MSVGSSTGFTPTSPYTRLPKGTRRWHVFPHRYDSLAFNPSSTNRFATPPPPDCAMFYAASSSAGALWEAVLRNLVIDGAQPQHVDPGLVAGKSIVELEVTQEIKILDLRSPHFRRLSSEQRVARLGRCEDVGARRTDSAGTHGRSAIRAPTCSIGRRTDRMLFARKNRSN